MPDLLLEYQTYIKIGGAIAVGSACILLTGTLIKKWTSHKKAAKLREEWDSVGKDVVLLHQFAPVHSAPSLSPFPIKLETYLRMADIKYVNDFKSPRSPKGKTPWITINGQDVSDSQLAIEYLAKKFERDFSKHLSEEERAIARAFRVMVEERVYWGLVMDRWVHEEGKHVPDIMSFGNLPRPMVNYIIKSISKDAKKATFYQGLGRHSKEEIQGMIMKDLEAISVYLGNKSFFMGPEPCEVDCTMFGFICQFINCTQSGCAYTDAINREYPNLIEYHERMKDRFWPDWNDCLREKK